MGETIKKDTIKVTCGEVVEKTPKTFMVFSSRMWNPSTLSKVTAGANLIFGCSFHKRKPQKYDSPKLASRGVFGVSKLLTYFY